MAESAIVASNATEISVTDLSNALRRTLEDRFAYVRVRGEDEITVTQETLRRYLGADYEIRSFGGIMSAFSGKVINTSDAITWQTIGRGKAQPK